MSDPSKFKYWILNKNRSVLEMLTLVVEKDAT